MFITDEQSSLTLCNAETERCVSIVQLTAVKCTLLKWLDINS